MTFDERLAAIRANMIEQKLDLLVAIHDGAHFIETPNPVLVLSGFKSLGPAAVVLRRDGETSLIVTPAWDAERAARMLPERARHRGRRSGRWAHGRAWQRARRTSASPAWHSRRGTSPAA